LIRTGPRRSPSTRAVCVNASTPWTRPNDVAPLVIVRAKRNASGVCAAHRSN